MPYCSITEIRKRCPELTLIQLTDDNNSGQINSDIITTAILDADAIINSYIMDRYLTPLPQTNDLILKIAVNLALYFIYSRRYDDTIPAEVKNQFEESVNMLRDISEGRLKLKNMPRNNSSDTLCSKDEYDTVFSENYLNNY